MFNKHENKKLSLTPLLFFHELEKEKNARNRFTVFNELESEKSARYLLRSKILMSIDQKARNPISTKI